MSYTSKEIKLVHDAAENILSSAVAFGARTGIPDSEISKDLLFQAVDNTLSSGTRLSEINDLPAYLFVAYKRLIIAWCKQKQKEEDLEENAEALASYQDIERKILVEELVRMMSEQERFIYNYLVLGYSYKEIAEKFNRAFKKNFSANVMRSKLSKATQKISKKLLRD